MLIMALQFRDSFGPFDRGPGSQPLLLGPGYLQLEEISAHISSYSTQEPYPQANNCPKILHNVALKHESS